MKKIVLIIILIVFNFLLIYSKINSTNIEDIKIDLKDNEVGIVFLSLPNSKSLLIEKDGINILYIIDYINDDLLKQNVALFTDSLEYVVMNKDYDFFSDNLIVLDRPINIEGIQIDKNKIIYKNHTFCINRSSGCNYSYYIEPPITLSNSLDALFYDQQLSVKSLEDEWIDRYKIIDEYYTVMILNDEYDVITFLK